MVVVVVVGSFEGCSLGLVRGMITKANWFKYVITPTPLTASHYRLQTASNYLFIYELFSPPTERFQLKISLPPPCIEFHCRPA